MEDRAQGVSDILHCRRTEIQSCSEIVVSELRQEENGSKEAIIFTPQGMVNEEDEVEMRDKNDLKKRFSDLTFRLVAIGTE